MDGNEPSRFVQADANLSDRFFSQSCVIKVEMLESLIILYEAHQVLP